MADVGVEAGPMCRQHPTASPRQDLHHGDGGVVCREARTWAPWGACCHHGALPDVARPDAFERPTAPVFCNKCNPSYYPDITVHLIFRW